MKPHLDDIAHRDFGISPLPSHLSRSSSRRRPFRPGLALRAGIKNCRGPPLTSAARVVASFLSRAAPRPALQARRSRPARAHPMPPPLPRIETVKLRTGASMPLVGLGTAHLYRDAGRAAIADALDAGYRHVDCAKVYGNESSSETSWRARSRGSRAARMRPARRPARPRAARARRSLARSCSS